MTLPPGPLQFVSPNSKAIPRPKTADSPYFDRTIDEYRDITRDLLDAHPLTVQQLAVAALDSWNDIFDSNIGPGRIGVEIFPTAQVMGFLLHELIPLRVAETDDLWRRDGASHEKDLVYTRDSYFSLEIKTSSHKDQIFGNRSFGVEGSTEGKKAKSGYYLTVNFQSWADAKTERPEIRLVRFGWIDHTDWRAQAAATGQNSTLPSVVYGHQLAVIYERPQSIRRAR